MKRGFRLSRPADFKRVRRQGKSYPHPFLMLIVLSNDLGKVRVAVSANRKVGGAVQRNRAKRVLRAGIEPMLGKIHGGHDIILIAKLGLDAKKVQDAGIIITELLQKATLIERVK